MTCIKVLRQNGVEIRIKGHAGYAPAGMDIVCAGISVCVKILAHGIEKFGGASVFQNDDGEIVFLIKKNVKPEMGALSETVIGVLKLLSEEYPENLEVT